MVLGVLCCMLPLPLCFGTDMPATWYLVLPVCTWIIYLLDHVVDVTRKDQDYPTPRHRFVKKHLKWIALLIVSLSLFVLTQAIMHFNRTLFACGLGLSCIVLVHLFIVRINPQFFSFLNNKELAVSFVYASGIYLGPLSSLYVQDAPLLIPALCYVLFLAVTYVNLLMASLIEYDYDEQMQNSSWVRAISKPRAERIFNVLCAAVLISAACLLPFVPRSIACLLLSYQCIAAGHWLVYRFRAPLQAYLAYRKIAEALFWLPAVAYLLLL